MDYLTTYNKDYHWPYPILGGHEGANIHYTRPEIENTVLLWDPKFFSARVGEGPEVFSSRYDQPAFDKLQRKFPMLYSILENTPGADLKSYIERDKNKTTYQVDYWDTEMPSVVPTTGRSEYQDTISKLGGIIITRDQLHIRG